MEVREQHRRLSRERASARVADRVSRVSPVVLRLVIAWSGEGMRTVGSLFCMPPHVARQESTLSRHIGSLSLCNSRATQRERGVRARQTVAVPPPFDVLIKTSSRLERADRVAVERVDPDHHGEIHLTRTPNHARARAPEPHRRTSRKGGAALHHAIVRHITPWHIAMERAVPHHAPPARVPATPNHRHTRRAIRR